MLFSRRAPLTSVIEWCRVLRHSLSAGVSITRIFPQQAERGPRPLREVSRRVAERLQGGDSLQAALLPEQQRLPPLFVTLVGVGEETGHLPEIFGRLEEHYREQQQLFRQLYTRLSLPIFLLLLGVGIIAFLIWILGWIQGGRVVVTVLGLSGGWHALLFLACVGAVVLAFVLLWQLLRYWLTRPGGDAWLLRAPGLGGYLYSLALGRFCMTLALTLETGMSILDAIRLSLEATGSGTFAGHSTRVQRALRKGDRLTVSLLETGLFPEDFLHILETAEESGSIPEVLTKQARHYHEEASRRLAFLLRLIAGLGWLLYAGFTIAAIFSLAQVYLGQLLR